jgi:hypothetical protein
VTRKINIPIPTSPTALNVPATAAVFWKKPLLELGATTPVDEGVDRTMVVTIIVLPFETERNVDGVNEGGRVVLGVVVEVGEVEDVVDGGVVEVVVEVGGSSEVDGGTDVEVLPGVLGGEGAALWEEITLEVATELELWWDGQKLIFRNRWDTGWVTLTVVEQMTARWTENLHFRGEGE